MHFTIYAALLALFAAATWVRPAYVAAAVWAMFALDQLGQISHPYLLEHSAFTNVAIGVLIIVALLRSGMQAGFSSLFSFKMDRLQLAVVLLLCHAFLSSFWSLREGLALQRWSSAGLYMFAILVLLPRILRTAEDYRRAIAFFVLAATPLVLTLTFFTNWGFRSITIEGSNVMLGLPLALGEFGAVLFLMGIMVESKRSWLFMCIRIVAVATAAVLVVKSGARGAFIAMLLTVVMFAPGAWKLKGLKNPVVISIGLLAAVSLAFLALQMFMVGAGRWQTGDIEDDWWGRTQMAGALLQEWARGDLLTLMFGLGNSSSYAIIGIYPHILPAELLGEEGLLGLGLFAVTVVFTAKLIRQGLGSPVGRTLSACCCVFYLLSMKQGSLLSPFVFMFPILLERYVSIRIAGTNWKESLPPPAQPLSHARPNWVQ